MAPVLILGMVPPSVTDRLRSYFRRSSFYTYLLNVTSLSSNLAQEYQASLDFSNKHNLHAVIPWEKMDSFGEARKIVVLDLGGTNLNLFEVEIHGQKEAEVIRTGSLDFYQDKVYTPEILYADLKNQLDHFILDSQERMDLRHIVFIFSYQMDQFVREDGYVDAVCTYFGKMRKSDGLVGAQIGLPFEKFLQQSGYPNVKVAVTNDTIIYGLASKSYEINHGDDLYDAGMNIIVGTGANIGVLFDQKDEQGSLGLRVINTEFCDYKSVELSKFDKIFDSQSDSPGRYLMEKMISGTWMHQIFKVILKDLIEQKLINPEVLNMMNLNTIDSEQIDHLMRSTDFNSEDKEALYFIWREINKRGGNLSGMVMAVMMVDVYKKLGKDLARIIITETGSVFKKNIRFRESLFDSLDRELGRLGFGDKIQYKFVNLSDRAALGAVVFDTYFNRPKTK